MCVRKVNSLGGAFIDPLSVVGNLLTDMVSTRATLRRDLGVIPVSQKGAVKFSTCQSSVSASSEGSDISNYSDNPTECGRSRDMVVRKRQRLDGSCVKHANDGAPSETVGGVVSFGLSSFTEAELMALRRQLLDWYSANRRTFPWRTAPRYCGWGLSVTTPQPPTADGEAGAPYAIWVSEVMSQQTRIDVVIPYYERWMREFPTLRSLSEASLERVYELWAGLGYYRRARFLHEGAQQVIREHQGKLPGTVKELRRIRGIGPYTAGAIASIAFGVDTPCVDGNVTRVLQRLCFRDESSDTDVQEKKANETVELWKLAEQIVKGTDCAGDINQALMEMGATVCKPYSADCGVCPINTLCNGRALAVADGLDNEEIGRSVVARCSTHGFSKRGRLKKIRTEGVVAVVAWTESTNLNQEQEEERNEKDEESTKLMVLLTQRKGQGLLGGLWEVVNLVGGEKIDEDTYSAMTNGTHKVWDMLNQILGPNVNIVRDDVVSAGQVKHIFSHIKQTLSVFAVQVQGLESHELDGVARNGTRFRWVDIDKVKQAAVSSQMRKVITRGMSHVVKSAV